MRFTAILTIVLVMLACHPQTSREVAPDAGRNDTDARLKEDPPRPPLPPPAELRRIDQQLELTAVVTPAGQKAPVLLSEVAPLIEQRCGTCHGQGAKTDLRRDAVAALPAEARKALFEEVRRRTVDYWTVDDGSANDGSAVGRRQKRMPPGAQLAPAETARLAAWYDDGYLVTPGPATLSRLFARPDALRVRYQAQIVAPGTDDVLAEAIVGLRPGQAITAAVPGVYEGETVIVRASLLAQDGTVLAQSVARLDAASLDETLALSWTVKEEDVLKHLLDQEAPVPSAAMLRVTDVGETTARLSWDAASDDLTPREQLNYAIWLEDLGPSGMPRRDPHPDLKQQLSTDDVARRARLVKDQLRGATAFELTPLREQNVYAAYCIVTDDSGKRSVCGRASFETTRKPGVMTPVCQNACQAVTAGNDPDGAMTAVCYACKCKEALGWLPKPEEMRCSDGAEIKVFQLTKDPSGRTQRTQVMDDQATECLNPALLSAVPNDKACLPGSRLGQLSRGGTHFKWICRKKEYDPNWQKPRESFGYNDFGIIGVNEATGASCFWDDQDSYNPAADREHLPSIDLSDGDPKKVGDFLGVFYNVDGIGCAGCHDSDPFIYTSYLEATNWQSSPAVTLGKYVHVTARDLAPVAAANKHMTGDELWQCTMCHRISDGASCDFAQDSLGMKLESRPYHDLLKSGGPEGHPWANWMPAFGVEVPASHDEWKRDYEPVRDLIAACCRGDELARCGWQSISAR